MSVLAKVFVIINLVFSVAYLSVSGTLYHHRQDWREAFNKITSDYRILKERDKGEIDTLENRIAELNQYIATLENQIGDLIARIDDVGQKYRNARTNLAIETQEMALLLTDHSRVVMVLKSQDDLIAKLRVEVKYHVSKFHEIMGQKNTAENQVARLTQMLMNTRKDLVDVRKDYVATRRNLNEKKLILQKLRDFGVPVEKIVLLKPPPPIDGAVVAYDEPTRLVLLSVGRQDNVAEGYEFTIYRGTRFIARVKVEKVLPDLCGARVIFEVAKIQKGDLAATRLH
jgi:predicted  nucleic acid-binding Zn-ribbon protein